MTTNYVELAIKKAIEGGWERYRGNFLDYDEEGIAPKPREVEIHEGDANDYTFPAEVIVLKWDEEQDGGEFDEVGYSLHEVLLSPDFWHALEKAEGWPAKAQSTCRICFATIARCDCVKKSFVEQGNWAWHWHELISHLASGNSPDSFFEQLLTEKR